MNEDDEIQTVEQLEKELNEEIGDNAALCNELLDAQKCIVLLRNQIVRHSIPYVPEAEAETKKALEAVERAARLEAQIPAIIADVLASLPRRDDAS